MRANASSDTGPDGSALDQAIGTKTKSPALKRPPNGMLSDGNTSSSLSPVVSSGQPSAMTKSFQLAPNDEKLLDSCWKPATATLFVIARAPPACESTVRGRQKPG